MKPPFVTPHGRIEAPQRKRPAATAGGTSFARHLAQPDADPLPAPVTETGETLPLEALLTLQSVADDTGDGRRQAGKRRGETLLDLLDRLRGDLLADRVPQARLVELAGLLRQRRETSGDAGLEQVIEEIELRAEVELAEAADAPVILRRCSPGFPALCFDQLYQSVVRGAPKECACDGSPPKL